ncbi:hypothetical protein [Cytobacillus purgationiresistens]|uniref:Lipoprotein n=1 Tax=Cytobacillus purgationiresistens TaxID=863449 RepID=A0ABU0AJL4_9BACI|nr:hypothetical protein [Cytobacillus purgationiresistens]MDQ0271442.1 hypothetical protein [Cytobacillus purgationiresistens]
MGKYLIILFLSIGLAACSIAQSEGDKKNDHNQIEAKVINEADEIHFSNGNGRVQISFVEEATQFLVLAEKLNPKQTYSISLGNNDGGGVIFGPEENVELSKGEIVGDTSFQPNANGELFVSMLNPNRVVQKKSELTILIKSDSGKIDIYQSEPFKIMIRKEDKYLKSPYLFSN